MTLFKPDPTKEQEISGVVTVGNKEAEITTECISEINYVEDDCFACVQCEYPIADYRELSCNEAFTLYRRVDNGLDALCWVDETGEQHCIYPV